jgi:hypothetical protein
MKLALSLGPMTFALPTIGLDWDIVTSYVTPAGDISLELTAVGTHLGDDTAMDPSVIASMRETLTALAGAQATQVMTNRAILKERGFTFAEGTAAPVASVATTARDALRHARTPLPEAAVGIGATWRVESKVDVNRVAADEVTHYRLVSWDGDTVRIAAKATQTARDAKLIQDGLELDVARLDGASSTELTVDLGRPYPRRVQSSAEFTIDAAHGDQQLTLRSLSRVTMELK